MSRFEFFTIIQDLKAEGKTILMATPYLDEAERGDNIVFIREGRVIRKNTIQRLRTEFPARLFRMRPKGNVFEALERMKSYPGPGHHVFLRGRTIRVLVPEGASLPGDLPVEDVEEQIPTLEDIYIYYERLENDHACR
jgi:ABC-2 type transport system ATP-binding protein